MREKTFRSGPWIVPCLFLLLVVAGTTSPAAAQTPEIDELASRIAREVLQNGGRRVAVFGFAGPDVKFTALGKVLGDELATALAKKETGFEVIDREQLMRIGADRELPAVGLLNPASGTWIGALAGADIVITGKLRNEPWGVELAIQGTDPKTNREVFQAGQTVQRTDALRTLGDSETCDLRLVGARIGICGFGFPKCQNCPDPKFPKQARDIDISGTVILIAAVNADGRITFLRVIKGLGYGLEESAVATVRKWRFEPIRKADGSPATMWLPIEINFRRN